MFDTSPKSFIGTNKVESVEVNKMKLGRPDSSGRRRPEVDKDEYKIGGSCDQVFGI